MALGTVETIIVCRQALDNITVSPCPAGQSPQLIQGFIVDQSAQQTIEALIQPFDFQQSIALGSLVFEYAMHVFIALYIYKTIVRVIKS